MPFKQIFLYGFWGVCTTIVNIGVFQICRFFWHMDLMTSNFAAWFLSVVFAFFVNKYLVFKSVGQSGISFVNEFLIFISTRIISGCLDMGLMFLFVELFKQDELTMKVIVNILVIVLNFIAARFLFKKRV